VRSRALTRICAAYCGACILLAAGCSFLRTEKLNQAIATGDMFTVQRALDRGVDVNGRGMHNMTPLMKAAEAGRVDLCKLLLTHGADPNGHNDSGSVLMWAVSSGNVALTRLLVDAGASRSWTNMLGQTAESIAVQRAFTDIVPIVTPNRDRTLLH